MLDPPEREKSFQDKVSRSWVRLLRVIKVYRPVAWLVVLTASLVVLLRWMPSEMRLVIWHGLTSRGILSGLLVVFSLLALSLVWSAGQRIDILAFLFFNRRGSRPHWLDWFMLGLTQLGSGFTAIAIGLILFFSSDRLGAYIVALGTLTLWIVVELVKTLVGRSRPFIRLTQTRIVGSRAPGRSFPSGHTSQAFFMATLLARHFGLNPWATIFVYGIALLIGITRMYVGAHYPRDVLAGALLGSAWGLLGVLVEAYVLGGM